MQKFANIVEFSSCSSDECNFSFYYGNGTQIPIDETTYQYRKTIFSLQKKQQDEKYIHLNLSLINSNSSIPHVHYHAIKYKIDEQSLINVTFDKLISSCDLNETRISSNWDYLKNNLNNNITINAIYYYYLFEKDKYYHKNESICYLEEAAFSNTTTEKSMPNNAK